MSVTGAGRPYRSACALVLVLVLVALAGGCGDSFVGPEDLEVSFALSADTVRFGDTFVAILTLWNPTDCDIAFDRFGCRPWPNVYHEGRELAWDGTEPLCLPGVTRLVVPGSRLADRVWKLRAGPRGHGEYDVPPEPGVYEVRMEIPGIGVGMVTAQLTVEP